MTARTLAIVHYSAPPTVGGVETVIGHHARLAARDGWNVKVIAGEGDVAGDRLSTCLVPELSSRCDVVVAAMEELRRGSAGQAFASAASGIENDLRRLLSDVDVCIVHNILSMHFNLPLTAAAARLIESDASARGRRRWIVWCHDAAAIDPAYTPLLGGGFPWDILRTRMPGAAYVTVSQERARALRPLYGEMAVVPNGVDVQGIWGFDEHLAGMWERHGLWDADLVLLTPARLVARKNIEFAVEVLAGLVRAGRDARLLVTAPPDPHNPACAEYAARLRALAGELGCKERLVLASDELGGSLTDRQMACLYRACDVLLVPSRAEGFGIPLLEAAAARLPAAVSGIEALREIGGTNVIELDIDGETEDAVRTICRRLDELATSRLFAAARRLWRWDVVWGKYVRPLLEGQ